MFKNLILVCLFLPSLAFGSTTSEIESIIGGGPDAATSFIIKFKTSIEVPGSNGCTSNYHYLNASTEKGKLLFSLLLSAKVSGQPVKIQFTESGCTGGGRGGIYGVTF